MAESAYRAYELPLHITKLQSPVGFQVWNRAMGQYLMAANLYQWTKAENKDAPAAEIPGLDNDGSNRLVQTAALIALEEKTLVWRHGKMIVCKAIISRLSANYYSYVECENETSAYKLWNSISEDYKPAGLETLKHLY